MPRAGVKSPPGARETPRTPTSMHPARLGQKECRRSAGLVQDAGARLWRLGTRRFCHHVPPPFASVRTFLTTAYFVCLEHRQVAPVTPVTPVKFTAPTAERARSSDPTTKCEIS